MQVICYTFLRLNICLRIFQPLLFGRDAVQRIRMHLHTLQWMPFSGHANHLIHPDSLSNQARLDHGGNILLPQSFQENDLRLAMPY